MTTLTQAPIQLKPTDYKSNVKPIWCPGCGDFGVLNSFYKMISDLQLAPETVAIASGIGCSGRFPAFVHAYGFHGVHGRVLPLATGIKLGNPDLTVYALGGDGDAFSIGMGHLPHAARRNVDITYIVMDNEIYGLTKGQPSPTSPLGMEKKASPYGSIDAPLDPLLVVLAAGATFVARGFSSRPKELTELLKAATLHKGFSFVQVYSPCVTFNNTYDLLKERTEDLPAGHDVTDRLAAVRMASDPGAIRLGIFYHDTSRPSYDMLASGVRDKARARGGFDLAGLAARYNTAS
jgi:2-oxoglutarate ferredoxin oxidoreductase subunit beta